jgi:cupin fold WbuC family metalloprotein
MKRFSSLLNKNSFKFYSYKNSDVFFLKKEKIIIKKNITDLICFGLYKKKDLKICMHSNIREKLHNMINFLYKKKSYSPHCHNSDEVYQFIKGDLRIIIFNRKLNVSSSLFLNKNHPIIRVKKNTYHVTVPVKSFSLFHEIKEGPFKKSNTIFSKKKILIDNFL